MTHVLITGATGMVGKAILLECLADARIDKVDVVTRKPLGMAHSKIKEILLTDFFEIASIRKELSPYAACFFCLGVSAAGMDEAAYTRITFDLTQGFADTLYDLNPGMTFNYVSGTGTDTSETGRSMWARVKGRTENMLFHKGFADAYAFRPGLIIPEKGIVSSTRWYRIGYALMRPFFPWLKRNRNVTTTTRIGRAMIATLFHPQTEKILHNADINRMAAQ